MVETVTVLNRVLALLNRSMPVYLGEAAQGLLVGDKRYVETVTDVVSDYKHYVDRISDLINESRETVYPGEFPLHFASLHDLSWQHLLGRMIDAQETDIQLIESCVEHLSQAPFAKTLIEEVLGCVKGHHENLCELQSEAAVAV